MDAFVLLKKDHKETKNLFKKLTADKNLSADEKENLFHELKKMLDAHAHIEENVFYPALKEAKQTHEITLEAYEEHHLVDILLNELAKMDKEDERWMVKLHVLKENVEHHIDEEEKQMFPKAQTILKKDQVQKLGEEMAAAKEEFLQSH